VPLPLRPVRRLAPPEGTSGCLDQGWWFHELSGKIFSSNQ